MVGAVERGLPLRKLLGRLVRLDTISSDFLQEADRLRLQGDLEGAALLCMRGLRRFPHYASAHVMLGEILRDQGGPDLAERHWREALRWHPQHPWAHLRLAQLHLGRGQVDEAMAELELSLLYSPNSPEATTLLDRARASWSTTEIEGTPAARRQARIEALLAAARRGADLAVVVGEGGAVLGGKLYPRHAEAGAASLGATLMLESRVLMERVGAGALQAVWVVGQQGSLQCYALDGVALLAVLAGAGAKSVELERAVTALREAEGAEGELR